MSQGDIALALSLHGCCPLSRRRDSLLSKTGFRGLFKSYTTRPIRGRLNPDLV